MLGLSKFFNHIVCIINHKSINYMKTKGEQTETRTHFFSDTNTYSSLGMGDAAKSVLKIPAGMAVTDYAVMEQTQVKMEGKKEVTTTKHFAVAFCGSTNENYPAYAVEVELEKADQEKAK